MNRIARKTAAIALAAAAALFATPAGAATDVTWTGTPLTASSTSIRTEGTLVYAYARGNYTANGVAFTGVGDKIVNTADCVVWEASGGAGISGATAPNDTDAGGYKDLLEHPWWASAKGRKIQLKNLEAGKTYLLQIVAFRDDYTTQTGQAIMVGDDPLDLKLIPLENQSATAYPYNGRYPCGTLVHNGVWYYGTYCLSPHGGSL